jgi:NADPH-dependent 2,4-dienoyl-CoA reductase/sulfur reductase-like enzyme
MEIIRGVRQAEGKPEWEGGKILDPENGKNTPCACAAGRRQAAAGARLHRPLLPHPGLATHRIRQSTRRLGLSPGRGLNRTSMNRFQVKKVAVLGAGVMGAQIAAHLVNVKVPVVLFDLPAKEGPKNGIVSRPSTA